MTFDEIKEYLKKKMEENHSTLNAEEMKIEEALKILPTHILVEELKRREGVTTQILSPEQKFCLLLDEDGQGWEDKESGTGPVIIFLVCD